MNNSMNRMIAEDALSPELRHFDSKLLTGSKKMNLRRLLNRLYALVSTGIILSAFAFIAVNVA